MTKRMPWDDLPASIANAPVVWQTAKPFTKKGNECIRKQMEAEERALKPLWDAAPGTPLTPEIAVGAAAWAAAHLFWRYASLKVPYKLDGKHVYAYGHNEPDVERVEAAVRRYPGALSEETMKVVDALIDLPPDTAAHVAVKVFLQIEVRFSSELQGEHCTISSSSKSPDELLDELLVE